MVPLPDLGVGNIVTLCQWVWKQYNNYQDAPNEFDQIASQANTCLTALKKVELELEKPHSLVQHAEPETCASIISNFLDRIPKLTYFIERNILMNSCAP